MPVLHEAAMIQRSMQEDYMQANMSQLMAAAA